MNKKRNLIVAIVFAMFAFFSSINMSYAGSLPNEIIDADISGITYPIRDNSLILVVHPAPDNSGDYMMTICNKKGHCRQTSMEYRELRYIGLFLEDTMQDIHKDLNQNLSESQWVSKQSAFRRLYTDYMNTYDQVRGMLKALH